MAIDESYPELISLAVHELRTPVGIVSGYLRMLQRGAAGELQAQQRKMIDEAEKSCARITALLAELSEVSKIDDGRVTLARKPIELFGLVADVAEHVHESGDRGVRLEVRGTPDSATMEGDAERLRAAFDAIFRAILREQPGPCTIVADRRVVSEAGGSSAVVVVADEHRVQGAYDAPPGPFDEKRGGLGLVLPIARRVIDAHGGRLWSPQAPAESVGAARGAAIVAFPLRR
jgi:two-component system cell cycle sensor histidine kinase PleC